VSLSRVAGRRAPLVSAALVVLLALAIVSTAAVAPVRAQEAVRVYAAGSLRAAFAAIADAFTARYGIPVRFEFGASGLLRERLERGEPADVFASASMEHPRTLASRGQAGPVVLFARNELCALARDSLSATPTTLLDLMLDPTVKLATSTPKADPSGDYAGEMFRKADALRRGSGRRLEDKALQLTGGPNSVRPPAGTSVYAHAIQQGLADIFLTYCTNARAAVEAMRAGSVVTLPPALRVGAEYGLTVLNAAPPERALKLALFIMSGQGQEIRARHGFSAPALPGD
jgi:molybdate transport system substrate-binding protein